MCRNIRTLHNFEPAATAEEVDAAALQYVRKIAGSAKPWGVAGAGPAGAETTRELLDSLVTTAPPKDREVEAAKARAKAELRYARA